MADLRIEPIPADNAEGSQYGYMIFRRDEPFLRCVKGGTGDCWNFEFSWDAENDEAPFHVCQEDLNDLIRGLTALRDSAVNADHVQHWAP